MKWRLLEGLPQDESDQVLKAARRRSFRRNEVVFHEGDPAESLHLVEEGRVAVRVTTPMGDEVTFEVLGPGDIFGEMALLGSDPHRNATVLALEESITLSIDRTSFDSLRKRYASVENVLVGILSDRVQRLSTYLIEALYVPADLRVLRRLLDLTKLYRDSEAVVVIPLTQEDLAGLAGTSRVTVNRILRDEERKGTISLARGHTKILKPEAIRGRAY